MGTSTNYNAPTTPQWRDLKREVTLTVRRNRSTQDAYRQILRDYIAASGGPRGMSRGGGGRGAQTVAGNLAGLLSSINELGAQEALRQIGLESLEGKTIAEVTFALLDYLGEHANTIDDTDARRALTALLDELLEDADDTEDTAQVLETAADEEQLGDILLSFFGYYLYERFCRVFYERLVARVGDARAEEFLNEIKEYIRSTLENETLDHNILGINWHGVEGKEISTRILEETLEVFTK